METETGLAFLSRVETRPNLNNLFKNLLSNPSNPPKIIEISGNAGCGKSLLCLDLITYALLPESIFGISLGGFGSSVIFVDCDQHFNILHFSDLMERKVKNICYKARKEQKKSATKSELKNVQLLNVSKVDFNKSIEKVIQDSLKNFIYLNCTSSHQFAVTILSLNQTIANKPNVSLIAIDSISSFYWYDRVYRVDNWYKMENYLNNIFKQYINMLKRNNLICVCTKQSLFKKRSGKDDIHLSKSILNDSKLDETVSYEYLGKEWMNNVGLKLCLSFNLSVSAVKNTCCVEAFQGEASKVLYCTFQEDGVRWLETAENQ